MMANVHDMRKRLLAGRIGDFGNIAPEDLLRAAEETEALLKSLGPFDPAYPHFSKRLEDFLNASIIRESETLGSPHPPA